MDKENCLTTGQLAKRTGITVRTLRYYDQIGLLSPGGHRTGSIRLYNMKDMERLQRIQMLKYLGLSLQKIMDILDAESPSNGEIRHSLQAQLDVLQKKIAHTEHVVHAIRDAMEMSVYGSDWNHLADVIQTVQSEQNWGSNIGRRTACKRGYIFTTSTVRILKAGIVGFLNNWKCSREPTFSSWAAATGPFG